MSIDGKFSIYHAYITENFPAIEILIGKKWEKLIDIFRVIRYQHKRKWNFRLKLSFPFITILSKKNGKLT